MQFQAFTTDNTESAELLTSGWHVVTLICGSSVGGVVSKSHILFDGAEVAGYLAQGDMNTCGSATKTGNYQIGGSSFLTGTWFIGKVAAVWAWGVPLTLNDGIAAALSALNYMHGKGVQTKYSNIQHDQPLILGGVDSRTAGNGLPPGTAWISSIKPDDPSYTTLNLGESGQTVLDACANAELSYLPYNSPSSGPVVAIVWGGLNDLLFTKQTPRQVANNLKCLVQKIKKTGARIILATEISAASSSNPQIDQARDNLNVILRAEGFSWGVDNVVDLATDTHLGPDGASSNMACFPDGLHPGPSCEPYVTAAMQNSINELLGSTETNRHETQSVAYQEAAGDRYLDLTGSSAQTITLPDCTGHSLPRHISNLTSSPATLLTSASQTIIGASAISAGSLGILLPVPGSTARGGCRWKRVE